MDVLVDRGPLGRVGVQVVVVEGDRRADQAVGVEQCPRLVGFGRTEAVDREMGGRERPVAQVGPGRHLEGLEALRRGPRTDLGQAPLGQAGREETEVHVATSAMMASGTMSTH